MTTRRPATLTIGAALLAVGGVVSFIPALTGWSSDDVPAFVVYGGYVLGALMLVGAYLAWKRRRWGMLLGLIAAVVNGLLTVPGIAFAPSIGWQIASAFGVLLTIVLAVMLLAPASRRAYA